MIRRPPTLARGGMVVASHPLAAEAGVSILRAGGHAVDAAVSAAAVLSVVEPSASGLGGDAFLLIWDQRDEAVTAVNGSGAAPASLTPECFAGRSAVPLRGALSATIPGCVAAWGEAWYGWGRLEWGELLAPALRLAEEGFPVSWRMGRVLRRERAVLAADAELSRLFLRSDGAPLDAGETCRPEALARTLKALASSGWEDFYTGFLAEALAAGVKAAGGAFTAEDLARHESVLLAPYSWACGELVFHEQPLPSQGILLLILYGLLDASDRASVPSRRDMPWTELHRQVQATRVAFGLRDLLLADPRTIPVREEELVNVLLSPELLQPLSGILEEAPLPAPLGTARILDSAAGACALEGILESYRSAGLSPAAGDPAASAGADTTYLCAADGEGNVAGLIQSIFHPFGCGFMEPTTGILLNNRAAGFSLDPRHPNRLEPGKRTLHTLNSYLVLRNGRPWLVGGTPGADHQVQTNVQVLRHLLKGRVQWPGPLPMKPQRWTQARGPERTGPSEIELLPEALEAPRWGVGATGTVRLEARFPAEVRRRIARMGHPVVRVGPWEGSGFVQAIRFLEDGVLLGATDPRGEGAALGL